MVYMLGRFSDLCVTLFWLLELSSTTLELIKVFFSRLEYVSIT